MKLSIITITKNNLEGLKKTIKSINSQTGNLDEFENIVIDGNSSDGTIAYLKKNNINFYTGDDSGIYDAFNKGILKASGLYINFLNSGDILYNEFVLSLYIKSIFDNTNKVIWFNNIHITKNNKIQRKSLVKKFLLSNFKIMPPHQSTLFPKSIFDNRKYKTNFKIAGDYEFFLYSFKDFKKGLFVNKYSVIQESGGISNNGILSIYKGNKEAYTALKSHTKSPTYYLLIKLIYKFYLRCKSQIF